MDRVKAKAWMADYLESVGMIQMSDDIRFATRLQFRASRHRGDGCLYVTEARGEWSGYYRPDEESRRLTLVAFGFGQPAGNVECIIDFDKIMAHFASDLSVNNQFSD